MKKTILLVALITFVAFVSGVLAQSKPATAPAPVAPAATKPAPPAQLEKFGGEIKSMNAITKSIVVANKKAEKTFVTDDSTKITKGKETVALADLKVGAMVLIEAKKEGDKLIASTIKLSVPKAVKK